MVEEDTARLDRKNSSSSSSSSSSSAPASSSYSFLDDDDDDDREVIYEKINYVFGNVCDKLNANGNGGVLVQFWAPKKVVVEEEDGRCILSTLDQPFVQLGESNNNNNNIPAYRRRSMPYHHTIINYSDDDIMKMAPAAAAFLNHFPELIMDLRSVVDHQEEDALLDYALKSGFTCCLFMPVFNPSSGCCLGVVECCMMKQSSKALLLVINYLKSALETVGLTTFNVQQFRPYEIICGLKRATNEIDVALEIVCESHYLTLAQVWISYENHVLFSSDAPTKQMFALNLIGYSVDSDDAHLFSSLMDYHDTCETLPLKIGQGLAGRTLLIHQPLFYRNVSELSDSGPLPLLPANSKCSCLTICLRSTHTGDLDYAFEFLWPQRRHHLILLESLLLTLKQCLPSFTFSFGATLGDKLRVLDVENSTGSRFTCFHIFHGNKLSGLPETLLGRRLVAKERTSSLELKCKTTSIPLPLNGIKQKFGSTMVTNLNEGQGQNFLKRKLSDLGKSQSDSIEKSYTSSSNSETSPGDDILIIKALYYKDVITFLLPDSSATLAAVKKEIDKGFELSGGYRLRYFGEDEVWTQMQSDEDVRDSIVFMRLSKSTHIRLRVMPWI